MLNPEEKDTIAFRVDYEKQCNYSDPITKDVREHKAKKENSRLEKLLNPWYSHPQLWNKIFLASCVIGVSMDPLFLYIPIVDETNKCMDVDQLIKYVALLLRSATDICYILDIVFCLQNSRKEIGLSVFKGLPWPHLVIDVLAILPLPQVIVLRYFALADSRYLMTKKTLNFFLLGQYIPRLLRVYLLAKELGRGIDSLARRAWVRGAFVFFLYIVIGHIFGALWYFYSIYLETTCWHYACVNLQGCDPSPFDCRFQNPIRDINYLNAVCPIHPPNSTAFFGIFSVAIESQILQDRNFPKKFFRCFWWGMQTLSSFGQNLETTGDISETSFAVLISVSGMLIFLYLIGTLQTYMQLATTKSEEARSKMRIKLPEVDSFLSSQNLPPHEKTSIMQYLQHSFKIPHLKNMDDNVYEMICKYLKPVTYAEKKFIIRKDEPVDFMLFVTQGILWSFGSETSPTKRLQKGNVYGKELLEWQLNSTSYAEFPISKVNLKCHTKVEAFALMAVDLEHFFNQVVGPSSQAPMTLCPRA